jgi:hypothetical protein
MNISLASVSLSIAVGALLIIMSQGASTRRSPEKPEMQKREASSDKKSVPRKQKNSHPLTIDLPSPPKTRVVKLELKTKPLKPRAKLRTSINLQPLKPTKISSGLNTPRTHTATDTIKTLSPSMRPVMPNKEPPGARMAKTDVKNPPPRLLSPGVTSRGRALLRILETGKGPVVTVEWPNQRMMREKIYSFLTGCYEMQTSIYVEKMGLYRYDDPPGVRWEINNDEISGFIRQPSGELSKTEQQVVAAIRSKHQIWSGIHVRVFPRSVDTALLGGLKSIIGAQFSSSKSISTRYFIEGDNVVLGGIQRDKTVINGSFILPKPRGCT